jgi:hypothetical protein
MFPHAMAKLRAIHPELLFHQKLVTMATFDFLLIIYHKDTTPVKDSLYLIKICVTLSQISKK